MLLSFVLLCKASVRLLLHRRPPARSFLADEAPVAAGWVGHTMHANALLLDEGKSAEVCSLRALFASGRLASHRLDSPRGCPSRDNERAMKSERSMKSGFGGPWFALSVALALHVLDEASTGFLNIYNPTVTALRERWGWFPMPTFQFREWLVGLLVGVAVCFALTPFAARGGRWMRP